MTTTTIAGTAAGLLTTKHKLGLGLATLLALGDLTLPFVPHPEGEGPPVVVDWFAAVLGLLTLAGVIWAFRSAALGGRRLVAVSRIVSGLLALPAFFVGVPAAIQAVVAISLSLTVAVVVLVLGHDRKEAVG